MMYGSRSYDVSAKDRVSCHFGPFLTLDPPNNPKNQNFQKIKKAPEYYHFKHEYHNENHMMYDS